MLELLILIEELVAKIAVYVIVIHFAIKFW